MEKLAIIGFHNLHLMQFLYKYTDILDKNNISYDVLYWDRDMDSTIKQKLFNGNQIAFRYKMSNYQPKYRKIAGFIGCMNYFCKVIRQNKYDHVILLTTQTALPLYMLSRTVRKSKFIYDYRDLTYEQNIICKWLIQRLIRESEFTSISSLGFKEVLGETDKFVMSHNVSDLEFCPLNKTEANTVRIAYWGMVRQVEWNKRICDLFGNADGISLSYHGEGRTNELKEYCQQKGYRNVQFTGRYTVGEIFSFASDTDVLLNMYENDRQQRLAITVKLYDGIRYGLPILITDGSHMSKIMKNNPAVYCMRIDTIDIGALLDWCKRIDRSKYPYEDELRSIQKDDAVFEEKLLKFVKA